MKELSFLRVKIGEKVFIKGVKHPQDALSLS